ncbi:uncharacterized protein C8A04DRAFT_33406 [Dichotomopilus funicola]|uniref:Uncharacterized protein n=1 Tax=Dichotomopilus funicola TaxID=1934379 RepID=A0AAN6UTW5_9PEZI|nr:hypothetical protein C8A04DRAFT_33406 [Dichotomopilus funicola]
MPPRGGGRARGGGRGSQAPTTPGPAGASSRPPSQAPSRAPPSRAATAGPASPGTQAQNRGERARRRALLAEAAAERNRIAAEARRRHRSWSVYQDPPTPGAAADPGTGSGEAQAAEGQAAEGALPSVPEDAGSEVKYEGGSGSKPTNTKKRKRDEGEGEGGSGSENGTNLGKKKKPSGEGEQNADAAGNGSGSGNGRGSGSGRGNHTDGTPRGGASAAGRPQTPLRRGGFSGRGGVVVTPARGGGTVAVGGNRGSPTPVGVAVAPGGNDPDSNGSNDGKNGNNSRGNNGNGDGGNNNNNVNNNANTGGSDNNSIRRSNSDQENSPIPSNKSADNPIPTIEKDSPSNSSPRLPRLPTSSPPTNPNNDANIPPLGSDIPNRPAEPRSLVDTLLASLAGPQALAPYPDHHPDPPQADPTSPTDPSPPPHAVPPPDPDPDPATATAPKPAPPTHVRVPFRVRSRVPTGRAPGYGMGSPNFDSSSSSSSPGSSPPGRPGSESSTPIRIPFLSLSPGEYDDPNRVGPDPDPDDGGSGGSSNGDSGSEGSDKENRPANGDGVNAFAAELQGYIDGELERIEMTVFLRIWLFANRLRAQSRLRVVEETGAWLEGYGREVGATQGRERDSARSRSRSRNGSPEEDGEERDENGMRGRENTWSPQPGGGFPGGWGELYLVERNARKAEEARRRQEEAAEYDWIHRDENSDENNDENRRESTEEAFGFGLGLGLRAHGPLADELHARFDQAQRDLQQGYRAQRVLWRRLLEVTQGDYEIDPARHMNARMRQWYDRAQADGEEDAELDEPSEEDVDMDDDDDDDDAGEYDELSEHVEPGLPGEDYLQTDEEEDDDDDEIEESDSADLPESPIQDLLKRRAAATRRVGR